MAMDDFNSSLAIIVAFLVVSRSTLVYNDYLGHRAGLQACARASRELVAHVAAFTRKDTDPKAKEWRFDIARETLALMRTMVTGACVRYTMYHVCMIDVAMGA